MQTARLILTHQDTRTVISFEPPQRLSDLLIRCGAPMEMPCGGRGTCLKCKVQAEGALSAPDSREQGLLGEQLQAGMRYACMAHALGDVQVELIGPRGKADVQTEGMLPDFLPAPWGKAYGMAVDIGTTTVAAYLYRLSDGAALASASALNPQAAFGADVISRIQQSMGGNGNALAERICACLADLLRQLCEDTGVAPEAVDALTIAGNTAMLTLLCGLDPSPLASMPFRAEHLFGEFRTPPALSLPGSAQVYLARCIDAYVGADITAALLAADLFRDGRVVVDAPHLLVDVGTNGEIVLAAHGKLLCCATAAGPAFEGAGISCGMMARPGAIDRVTFEDGAIRFTVLGGAEAAGICGSGLIDAVASLLEAGILDESGVLEDGDYVFPGTQVRITQQDIRAVQLAKAAICAGMTTLIDHAGLTGADIQALVVAGGFGSHIRLSAAERIGLIPPGFAGKARTIGNGAGMGAAMMLLSERVRLDSERIRDLSEVVELSTNPRFMEDYVEGMFFPTA